MRISGEVCIDCQRRITNEVYLHSYAEFTLPLCFNCQRKLRAKGIDATDESMSLFIALRKKGIYAELEKYDGHKTVDLYIESARLIIEVDGEQHKYNPDQALADLKRTYFSFREGNITIRIPNLLVYKHFDQTIEYLCSIINECQTIVDLIIQNRKRYSHKKAG